MSTLFESLVKLEEKRKQEVKGGEKRRFSLHRLSHQWAWLAFFFFLLSVGALAVVAALWEIKYRDLKQQLVTQQITFSKQLDQMAQFSDESTKQLENSSMILKSADEKIHSVDEAIKGMNERLQASDNRIQRLTEDLGEEIKFRNDQSSKQSDQINQSTEKIDEATRSTQKWAQQW